MFFNFNFFNLTERKLFMIQFSVSSGTVRFLKPNVYDFIITEIVPTQGKPGKDGRVSSGSTLVLTCMNNKPVFEETLKNQLDGNSEGVTIRTTLWWNTDKQGNPIFSSKTLAGIKTLCISNGIEYDEESGSMGIDSFDDFKGCIVKGMSTVTKGKDGKFYNTINPESLIEADEVTEGLYAEYVASLEGQTEAHRTATTKTIETPIKQVMPTRRAVATAPVVEEAEEVVVETPVATAKTGAVRNRRDIFNKAK